MSGTVTVPPGHSTAGLRATQVVLVQDHDGQGWEERASVPAASDGSYVIETSTHYEYLVRFTDPSGVLSWAASTPQRHFRFLVRGAGQPDSWYPGVGLPEQATTIVPLTGPLAGVAALAGEDNYPRSMPSAFPVRRTLPCAAAPLVAPAACAVGVRFGRVA